MGTYYGPGRRWVTGVQIQRQYNSNDFNGLFEWYLGYTGYATSGYLYFTGVSVAKLSRTL